MNTGRFSVKTMHVRVWDVFVQLSDKGKVRALILTDFACYFYGTTVVIAFSINTHLPEPDSI